MQVRRLGFRTATALGGLLTILTLARSGFAVDIIDDPVQIDDRAAQVLQATNSLSWELYRYHQGEADFRPTYRMSKELWSRAGDLRDSLRAGPMETEALMQQVTQMNDMFAQLEKTLSKWGDGDRSLVPPNGGSNPRTVVTPGVGVDVPFVGLRVGGPRVVVTEGGPLLERRRLHPNSPGSKRSLERELAAVKVAVGYLVEDAGISAPAAPPAPGAAPAPPAAGPVPNPPDGPSLGEPVKIVPPSAKTSGSGSSRK